MRWNIMLLLIVTWILLLFLASCAPISEITRLDEAMIKIEQLRRDMEMRDRAVVKEVRELKAEVKGDVYYWMVE